MLDNRLQPWFVPGELVTGRIPEHSLTGMVISVVPVTQVPDARERGFIPSLWGWQYYVLPSDGGSIRGPLRALQLSSI